jgi:mRNA-degrading endonuclease RelE of RelBE toxin-antitoxin system
VILIGHLRSCPKKSNASIQKKRFRRNWRDPRLHIKKIRALPYALSFRITRRYRVFFYFQNVETAIFFEIDHRKDVYK